MKIQHSESKPITVADMDVGEVFLYRGAFYLVAREGADRIYVDIESGYVENFDGGDEVERCANAVFITGGE